MNFSMRQQGKIRKDFVFLERMVRPGGFELPTFWFVARRSIQLSYGRTEFNHFSTAPMRLRQCGADVFLERWSNISRNIKPNAHYFRLVEPLFEFLVHAGMSSVIVCGLCPIQKLLMSSGQRLPRSHVLQKRQRRGIPFPFRQFPSSEDVMPGSAAQDRCAVVACRYSLNSRPLLPSMNVRRYSATFGHRSIWRNAPMASLFVSSARWPFRPAPSRVFRASGASIQTNGVAASGIEMARHVKGPSITSATRFVVHNSVR